MICLSSNTEQNYGKLQTVKRIISTEVSDLTGDTN